VDGLDLELFVEDDAVEIWLYEWLDGWKVKDIDFARLRVPNARLRVYGHGILNVFADKRHAIFGRLSVLNDLGQIVVKLGNEEIWQWELRASSADSTPISPPEDRNDRSRNTQGHY
jgi:hypothetical protein